MSSRRALVTGASSGIGEATARLLASEGFSVALLARRAEELERVRASLAESRDPARRHLVVPCDLRDADSIDAAVARVEKDFGGLELLVHNAGIGYLARIEQTKPELIRAVFETNVASVLDLSRAALPLLKRGTRPVVVLISSVVGRRGMPGQIVYASSKAALTSIAEGLRVEWAEHAISVSLLDVSLTRTEFFAHQANPARLTGPNLAGASDPADIAREILALDRRPEPERNLSRKWRWLAIASAITPRLADRMLVRKVGGGWREPTWPR